MSFPPLYDPTKPEDFTEPMRVAYGLIGILLEIVGERVEVPASRMKEIAESGGPVFGIGCAENGALILTPDNCDEADSPSEFE